ncbi:hypothetical protein OROHE_015012 [Orobanche hederae]
MLRLTSSSSKSKSKSLKSSISYSISIHFPPLRHNSESYADTPQSTAKDLYSSCHYVNSRRNCSPKGLTGLPRITANIADRSPKGLTGLPRITANIADCSPKGLIGGVRSFSDGTVSRESLNYDVVIVGAGPSGLSAAIRLKQLCKQKDVDLSVCVVEKGAEVGAHILSGNVFEPRALDELLPNWKQEEFCLSQLVRWLGVKAEELGVEIYPGFAASEILYDTTTDKVVGIATNDMGVAKDGSKKDNFQPGVELKGRVTLFAEGCRGSLSEKVIEKYNLRDKGQGQHQTYALGIKEVWEITAEKHHAGAVLHTIGWPLDPKTYGGSFLYHMKDRQVAAGFVVALNYRNPFLNPYEEFQKFKHHPSIRAMLEGGTVIEYGARTLNEGGYQSIPYPVFPGGAIIGCSAGFLNVPKLKGSHTAMKSGMLAAESVFGTLNEGTPLEAFWDSLRSSWIWGELYRARNYRPAFEYGLFPGLALSCLEHYIMKGRSPWTLKHGKPDYKATDRCVFHWKYLVNSSLPKSLLEQKILVLRKEKAKEVLEHIFDQTQVWKPINYQKPDGVVSFDIPTSLYRSNTNHDHDQPAHLRLTDPKIPELVNLPLYAGPESRYCPARVYDSWANDRYIVDEKGDSKLQINAQNCLHCKACDIKDPKQNIKWTVPEGGGGPGYTIM